MSLVDLYESITPEYSTTKLVALYEKHKGDPSDEKTKAKFSTLLEKSVKDQQQTVDLQVLYAEKIKVFTEYKKYVPKKGTAGTGTLYKSIESIDSKIKDYGPVTKKNRTKVTNLIKKQLGKFIEKIQTWTKNEMADGQLASYVSNVVKYLDDSSVKNQNIVSRCRKIIADIGDNNTYDVGELIHWVKYLKNPNEKKVKTIKCTSCDAKTQVRVNNVCLGCFSDQADERVKVLSEKESHCKATPKFLKDYGKASELYHQSHKDGEYTQSEALEMHKRLNKCESMLKDVNIDEEELSSSSEVVSDDEEDDDDFDDDGDVIDMDIEEEGPLDAEILEYLCNVESAPKRQKTLAYLKRGDRKSVGNMINGKSHIVTFVLPDGTKMFPSVQPELNSKVEAEEWADAYIERAKQQGIWTYTVE